MKLKIIATLSLVINLSLMSQTQFELTIEGYNQPLQESTLKRDSIYTLTENWVKRTFIDSDEVIQSTVKNEMIRFQTFIPNAYRLLIQDFNLKIRFRVDIKDEKYRLSIEEIQDQPSDGIKWRTMDLPAYFNKKGDLRKIYIKSFDQINKHLNRINLSLYQTILNKDAFSDDDWE